MELDRTMSGKTVQIVGVVRDAKYNDIRGEIKPMFYMPLTQLPRTLRALEVRTTEPLGIIAPVIRRALAESAAYLMVRRVFTLGDQVERTIAGERMVTNLCAFFSAIALLLAGIGLYGVMAFSVANRTPEIGIRVALGATRRDVLWMILRQSLGVVLAGIVLGVAVALVSARLVATFLFGLTPTDPGTLAAAMLLLTTVALAAALIPALRATRVDPVTALRYE